MKRNLRGFAAAGWLFLTMFAAEAAFAQKQGGILKLYSPDSPASMSIHEEATVFAEGPMMGVFNNLVMYDQHVPRRTACNRLCLIWPQAGHGTRTAPN
jgi:peptide/nickel transport system substrate-binding protein